MVLHEKHAERLGGPEARRARILELLREAGRPLTGGELAQRLGTSRQVIVQDIAVLRAAGVEILATPRGYCLPSARPVHRALVAVRHTPDQTEDELTLLVDLGVEVVDVIVEHAIYGELRGSLHIASREDVRQFMEALRRTGARLLSELTEGLHLHTLEARSPEILERAREALRQRGYLVE
ncbi:MAG TPA: transcription repressor NadR [Thermoflexus sp.]|nr:transcription repressor NadR [Thermoflexus sp.]